MPDIKKDSPSSPQQPSEHRSDEAPISEQLERLADEMADQAQKVERRYDQDHDIFTK
jgi:hypothetical protein